MDSGPDKENIADGLLPSQNGHAAPSPRKVKTKKTRSASMGPGSLNMPLKEEAGNRRKVSYFTVLRNLPI
jgi:kinetochore protein Spc7/SPC105